ncbi:MAG: PDZ domain-containing protein, partial [Calditrichia bacterium]
MFARFSQDGSKIAFTGQYDGNTEVYLMPAQGGQPERLTYTATLNRDDISDRMGPNNIVICWKNDNQHIVFRSRMHSYNPFIGQLFTVTPEGGLPQELPLPRGGFCSFSPDNKKLAYNRVFREFRTWKKYRGGMADDIWIYDFDSKEVSNITSNPAQDIIPMWSGQNIYFLSDRDSLKRMNLYVYNLDNQQTRRLTDFKEFDIKFPSLGPDAIVFENGGYIYRFDLQNETSRKIEVEIANDLVYSRSEVKKVSDEVSNYEIAPDGSRALFGARGDVFTVPAKNGPTRNITRTSGVHERNAKWSPDGKWIAYISDRTGEDEIYIEAQDGSGEPEKVTSGGETYKYQIYWSPDSRKIMWADRLQRLRYVDISTKQITTIVKSPVWEIRDYAWSPDSRWIAYAEPQKNHMDQLFIYSLERDHVYPVTEGWFDSYSPAFSEDGKYLFFVSERDFNPIYSETEWNHAYQDMARLYLVTLAKKTASPFEPESDEVKIGEETEKEKKESDQQKKSPPMEVDPQNLKDRIAAFPIPAARYRNIGSAGDQVYYIRSGLKEEKPVLEMFDLKEKKEKELGQINGYEISADHKKMLVGKNGSYAIIDLPKSLVEIKEPLDLSNMDVKLNREAEWQQIFEESWRQMREFFYAPNMHGVDWQQIKEKYRPLVAHVKHRADLNYILGEMIGELNVGHAYVGGGDVPKIDRVKTGLLGAELERDPATGYYRITEILPGQTWNRSLRSPLRDMGVDVKEGDYIIAVDGQPVNKLDNIYSALVNTAGKQVQLRVNDKPAVQGSRLETVIPVDDESDLYYFQWVQENIEKVNAATDGKVGYIHVPDMGRRGLNEFVKYYYPQLQKKGLIIDVRGNGGGNVSPMLIERLRREVSMIEIARNGAPTTEPFAMVWGPKVALVDEFSASDGDLFAYQFKKLGLGTLIGKTSWGGVVGIRGSLPLLDGGDLRKPEFSRYGLEGKKWVIEGVGVEPDIVVDNDPAKEYQGIDQQLNKAIEVIMEQLKTEEKTIPPVPEYPVRK